MSGPGGDAAARITDLESAARRVVETVGMPLHERATIATLESEGVRDVDAGRIVQGCADVFALGRLVHARCLASAPVAGPAAGSGPPIRLVPGWKRLARRYRRGAAYYLPMIAQGLALATLGVSVWGSPGLAPSVQTAIGLALVLSLIGSGPATQAVTQRLYYYGYQDDPRAMQRTARRCLTAGAGGGAVVGVLAAVFLASRWSDAAFAFCVFLALQPSMWIANATLFALRRSWVAGVAVLAPTLPTWAALRLGLPPAPVHALALALADILLVGGTLLVLRQRARGAPPARRPLPFAVLPVTVGGYAVWGLVYFLLIFTDRIVAWTSGATVAFDPRYEAVLQVALLPLLLILPALEHVLVRFGELLNGASRRTDTSDVQLARDIALRSFVRLVGGATIAYVICAAAVWLLVERFSGLLPLGAGDLVSQGRATLPLLLALMAYGCFVVALGIGSAYQLLQRPWPLAAAGAAGVVADAVVGLSLRSADAPEHAAFGLLTGAIVFLVSLLAIALHERATIAYRWFAAG